MQKVVTVVSFKAQKSSVKSQSTDLDSYPRPPKHRMELYSFWSWICE